MHPAFLSEGVDDDRIACAHRIPDGTDLSGTVVGEDGNPFLKERVGPIALQHLQEQKSGATA